MNISEQVAQLEADNKRLREELQAKPTNSARQDALEAYMLTLADDIEYQERRIEKGWDVDTRILARVNQYRELCPKEG